MKTAQQASTSGPYYVTSAMPSGRKKSAADDEMMQCVKQALKDDGVIATLASMIADSVANKINDRLNHLEKNLKEKDQRIDQLEKKP